MTGATISGVVPQVAAMVGPGAAGTAYIPGLADYVPMVKNVGSLALGGPARWLDFLLDPANHQRHASTFRGRKGPRTGNSVDLAADPSPPASLRVRSGRV